ncbi:diacylglycerol kinase [Helicobacter sp. 11S03491-1]|uniref:diacylglycerol kinase n=1 Tax=Helicobacter sp. 11S03491-1 TaxID=1476196 RepID=UPI000BA68B8C|nr:diacylglycerol kinase [Helicobacter sp. 11S03491-1]PAF41714.1 diacylglycerol kinase [Helicobacter sp. 11S03491-1]
MQPNRNNKKGKKGLKRVWNAFFYSKDGLLAAWKDEAAFRQIFVLALACILLAFFMGNSWAEYILLILPCVISIIAELINTAIENTIDFVSLQSHPLAKKAKDIGSAIQFVALIFWIGVWGSFIWCHYIS